MNTSEIRRIHQRVQESLLFLTHSLPDRAVLLRSWVRQLLAVRDLSLTRRYLLEVTPILLETCREFSPIGCEVSFVNGLRDTVRRVSVELRGDIDEEDFREADEALKRDLRILACWLGEAGVPGISAPDGEEGMTEYERLAALVAELRMRGEARAEEFTRILGDWNDVLRIRPGSVVIPTIEHEMTYGMIEGFRPFTAFAKLEVKLSKEYEKPPCDTVRFVHGAACGARTEIVEELQTALLAVRSAGARLFVEPMPDSLKLEVRCATPAAVPAHSLGLGVSACALCEWSQAQEGRLYNVIGGGALFTGRIEADGHVSMLPDDHVASKVQAAFYSPYRGIVVPKLNEAHARDFADSLRRKHPRRMLHVIGVNTLRQVFDHRIAVETRVRPTSELLRKNLVKRRGKIAVAVLSMLALLCVGYFLFVADFDTNPAGVSIVGNTFRIVNKNGKLLWSVPVCHGQPLDGEIGRALSDGRNAALVRYASVYDLDGDGVNEVLIGRPVAEKGFSDRLSCYNADGSVRWESRIGKPVVTLDRDFRNAIFRLGNLWVGSFAPGEPPSVLAIARCASYPSFLHRFDARGKEQAVFYHHGALESVAVVDGPDMRKCIVVCGAHAGLRSAVLALLDPADMTGTGPEIGACKLVEPSMPPARLDRYLRFPRSEVAQAVDDLPEPIAVLRVRRDGLFDVFIPEANLVDRRGEYPSRPHLLYRFDSSLNPIEVEADSGFERLSRTLFESGSLPRLPGRSDLDSCLARLEMWDGNGFVRYVPQGQATEPAKKNIVDNRQSEVVARGNGGFQR
ncbi:MAG: hypothetical protein QHI48_02065 [Bacteroidota bacterium]|nr:hypothetical protein [Bacteroidota bacterium]